jgi:predicted transcriptional regulator
MTHTEAQARRMKIADYARRHPELKQKQIGEKFGITQSQVSQASLMDGYSRQELGERCRFDVNEMSVRRKVADFLKKNPDVTFDYVAKQFGLTRDQVSGIADNNGLVRHAGRRPGYKMNEKTRRALRAGLERWLKRK